MKVLVLFGFLAIIACAYAASAPQVIYDGPTYELKPVEDSDSDAMASEPAAELAPLRHRRVTCDVLSFQSKWLSINHSACAVRCLTQRRRGGRCQNGVCVCRG